MTSTAQNLEKATGLPDWIRVVPLGKVELADHREPFVVDKTSLNDMVTAFHSRGVDLVIDYEHQSLNGDRAPAAGWIKNLEARGDGLWAQVDWTAQAQDYLLKREYRYFSPVLRLDPETRKPTALMHLALTNVPAIKHLPPLVAKWESGSMATASATEGLWVRAQAIAMNREEENNGMVEEFRQMVEAGDQTDDQAVWEKVRQGIGELAALLDLPEKVSISQLREAVMALKAVSQRLPQVEDELQAMRGRFEEEAAARVVEEAMKAGKVIPAQKDWALEYYRQDAEGFRAYVARAPKLVPVGEELVLQAEDNSQVNLLLEEKAICRSLNISPEQYLQARDQGNRD